MHVVPDDCSFDDDQVIPLLDDHLFLNHSNHVASAAVVVVDQNAQSIQIEDGESFCFLDSNGTGESEGVLYEERFSATGIVGQNGLVSVFLKHLYFYKVIAVEID